MDEDEQLVSVYYNQELLPPVDQEFAPLISSTSFPVFGAERPLGLRLCEISEREFARDYVVTDRWKHDDLTPWNLFLHQRELVPKPVDPAIVAERQRRFEEELARQERNQPPVKDTIGDRKKRAATAKPSASLGNVNMGRFHYSPNKQVAGGAGPRPLPTIHDIANTTRGRKNSHKEGANHSRKPANHANNRSRKNSGAGKGAGSRKNSDSVEGSRDSG